MAKNGSRKRLWLRAGLALLFLVGAALLIFPLRQTPRREGPVYASLNELVREQEMSGYLKIGSFGNDWPATLVETIEGEGSVRFQREDGTPHVYQKFEGYRLRVLRLNGAKESEVILVLRSADKVGDSSYDRHSARDEDAWERERRQVLEERAAEEER